MASKDPKYLFSILLFIIIGVVFGGLVFYKIYSPPQGQGASYKTVYDQSGSVIYSTTGTTGSTRTAHNFHTEEHLIVHPGDIVQDGAKYYLVLPNGTVREVSSTYGI